MMMTTRKPSIAATITLLIILILVVLISTSSASSRSYVEEACSVTRYRELCIRSLASFSPTAKSSPSKWARAAVSVTLSESKNLTRFLLLLLSNSSSSTTTYSVFKPGSRNRVALSDCIELCHNAVDSLHQSLGVVRNLGLAEFNAQMEDLTTWLSSALTDGDTCLDGFVAPESDRKKGGGVVVEMVKRRVRRVGYITSNALALVNRLASTGLAAPTLS